MYELSKDSVPGIGYEGQHHALGLLGKLLNLLTYDFSCETIFSIEDLRMLAPVSGSKEL